MRFLCTGFTTAAFDRSATPPETDESEHQHARWVTASLGRHPMTYRSAVTRAPDSALRSCVGSSMGLMSWK
jgi:hypothetical protein